MLQHLSISNYALIEQLEIDFTSGFSVITGETGAGKSIILGALGLLCGSRADVKAIKAGAQKCCVEADFNIEGLGLESFFEVNDLDFDGASCCIRRELTAAGKSRAFLNDTPVTLAQLKQISTYLIDVHSQHQNLLMGREDFLLSVLDAVAANDAERAVYAKAYADFQSASRKLEELRLRASDEQCDTEYISFQLAQLEEAHFQPGEQEELEQEQEQLAHAEDIKRALCQAGQCLSSDESSVSQQLRATIAQLHQISDYYAASEELAERIDSCRIELDDVLAELEQAADRVEYNPERLVEVDERLSLLYSLLKKHRCTTIDELQALQQQLQEQLDESLHFDERLQQMEAEVAQLKKQLHAAGKKLTATRMKAADLIAAQLTERLQTLGMPSVQTAFEISPRSAADRSGLDAVVFMFSANKKVPMQDVAQIASGGEIARLMLSLKAMLAQHQQLPTIVFDEIDTGVSGKMAESMARVMQQMAARCQVLCITHLPQIAALGTKHYMVYKTETEEQTVSNIVELNDEQRIREVATMLSGADLSEAAIENAKSLLRTH